MSIRQWKRIRRTAALGFAALAVAAPSAGAVIPSTHGGGVQDALATETAGAPASATGPLGARLRPDDRLVTGTASATTPVPTVAPSAEGFDWGDAGIGFGIGLAAVIGLAGSARLVRQVRAPKPAAL